MRYSSPVGLYGALLVTALGGCGDKTQVQTGRAVSGLENTVLAETRTNAEHGNQVKKDELDLSTPEKAVFAYLEAYETGDYESLLATTTDQLNQIYRSDRETSLKEVKHSAETTKLSRKNIENQAVNLVSANEAHMEVVFNSRVNIPGQDGLIFKLRLQNNKWKVYDQ